MKSEATEKGCDNRKKIDSYQKKRRECQKAPVGMPFAYLLQRFDTSWNARVRCILENGTGPIARKLNGEETMNRKTLGWLSAIIGTTLVIVAITSMAGAEEYEVTAADCDFNNDCVVNESDYTIFDGYYKNDSNLKADINQDGKESSSDISYFMKYLGEDVPDCPPETFEPEEWNIAFSWNETENTAVVTSVSGNMSWEDVTVILEPGSFVQQPIGENVTIGDTFEVTSGNLSIFYPEDNDPDCWQNKHFYHIFEPINVSEPDIEPVENETSPDIETNETTEESEEIGQNQTEDETQPQPDNTNETTPQEPENETIQASTEDNFNGILFSDIDFNDDGYIDCTDYNMFQEHYGPSGGGSIYDLNADGQMNSADVSYFMNAAEYFGAVFNCTEEEQEQNETMAENDAMTQTEQEINSLETNISQLEEKRDHIIKLRDSFSNAIHRARNLSPFLERLAAYQIENVFNTSIQLIGERIDDLNGQLLELLSHEAQTFIANEG